MQDHHLELLAPARDAEIGMEAIQHGADAVYIGGPSFGARSSADNSVADIARLVQHAHRFNARIFVTVNTILRDDELEPARKLAWKLYDAGVDALIVQDMGLLEIDLPPGLGMMRADLTKVRQALFNLLSNASKFTEHGTITLQAGREATNREVDWIVLRVKDTGIGMKREAEVLAAWHARQKAAP